MNNLVLENHWPNTENQTLLNQSVRECINQNATHAHFSSIEQQPHTSRSSMVNSTTSVTPVRFSEKNSDLFPFNGCRRLTGDVINNTVDAFNFFHDSGGHLEEKFPGEFHDVCGYGIHTVDGADGDNVVIASAAVTDTGGFDGDEDSEGLPGFGVPAGSEQFFSDDVVCFTQDSEGIP